LNSNQNKPKQFKSIQKQIKQFKSIQNNSPNVNENDNDNEKEKKKEKQTSKETNRETDKVQEAPFFLDSESSEEEEREKAPETSEEAQGESRVSFHGEPPFDATAPPSRSNAGVSDAPESRPQAQDFARNFQKKY
jgi:hypothetical protein